GVTEIGGYYLIGIPAPPSYTDISVTPEGNQCTHESREIIVEVTPAGSPIETVVLKYRVNGGAVQSVSMANIGGNNWSAEIPMVTPANAEVTWHIEATDAGGLIGFYGGNPYKDEPLFGATAEIEADNETICEGASVELSLNLTGAPVSGQIGIGTTTTSTSGNTPFTGIFEDSRIQYLIHASELQ